MSRKPGSKASPAAYTNALSINKLSVDVHLGAEKKERQTLQKIIIDVRFYLPSLMSSAGSDNGEYICYHDVSEKIHALCVGKEYRLIEYLAGEIYRLIRSQTLPAVKLWVRLHKPRILLPYVEEGSSFTTCDLPPGAWVIPE